MTITGKRDDRLSLRAGWNTLAANIRWMVERVHGGEARMMYSGIRCNVRNHELIAQRQQLLCYQDDRNGCQCCLHPAKTTIGRLSS